MFTFFSYLLLGLVLASPIGPINAAQLDKGLKGGFWHSWLVGLGGIVADAIYILLVFFGIVHFLEHPFMKALLWSFGFFVLVYTGIETLLNRGKLTKEMASEPQSPLKSFLHGFFIAITNPMTILFWLGIFGSVLATTIAKQDTTHIVLYCLAIFSGLMIWDILIAAVASSFRKFFDFKILSKISLLSGCSLIAFGVYFGFQAFHQLRAF